MRSTKKEFVGLLWLEHRKIPPQMERRNQSDSNPYSIYTI